MLAQLLNGDELRFGFEIVAASACLVAFAAERRGQGRRAGAWLWLGLAALALLMAYTRATTLELRLEAIGRRRAASWYGSRESVQWAVDLATLVAASELSRLVARRLGATKRVRLALAPAFVLLDLLVLRTLPLHATGELLGREPLLGARLDALLELGAGTALAATAASAAWPVLRRTAPPLAGGSRAAARELLLAGIALLGAFLGLALAREFGDVSLLDRDAERLAAQVWRGSLRPILDALAMLGSPSASSVLIAALAGATLLRSGWRALAVLGTTLGLLLLVEGVLRIRLDAISDVGLVELLRHPEGHHLTVDSFPSGHVARFMLIAGMTVPLLGGSRRVAYGCAVVVGVAIAFQRVGSGAHSGADVVGGLLLGGGLTAVAATALVMLGDSRPASRTNASSPSGSRPASVEQAEPQLRVGPILFASADPRARDRSAARPRGSFALRLVDVARSSAPD